MAPPRKRRATRPLQDLPGLFDAVEIDMESDKDVTIRSNPKSNVETEPQDIKPIDPADLNRRQQVEFISFGSGSSGNCAYIGIRGQGGILIDAGIDATTLYEQLKLNCIDIATISGIIVTHDHSDHVRFAYNILRKNGHMAIYCTPRTLNGILRRHSISRRIKEYHHPIYKEFEFTAGPFVVTPFEVSHDGTDNVGFAIRTPSGRVFVVATDMGIITDRADYYIRQANMLMIEANYDPAMLTSGTYPEYLKARIRGERGHLANDVTARYLADIKTPALRHVLLCHLSQDNNTPELALTAIRQALIDTGAKVGDGSGSAEDMAAEISVSVLPRYESSPLHIF